jgi:hypothetical protein
MNRDHLSWTIAAAILAALLLCAALAMLSGCMAVGRWLAPIQVGELDAASQKTIADMKEADKKTSDTFNAEIVKLKASKPAALWPLYVVGAVCLAGGAAVGYFLGNVAAGVLFALGGAGCIVLAYCLESLPQWSWWIPFGLALVGGCIVGYRWYRSTVTVKALVPAIETAEPKAEGSAPSGQVKALVAVNSAAAGTGALVTAEVASVKKTLGI